VRNAVIAQLVNKSARANLRATKMLIEMISGIEERAGVATAGRHHEDLARTGAQAPIGQIRPRRGRCPLIEVKQPTCRRRATDAIAILDAGFSTDFTEH
jgi:hypothetical protein